MTVQVEGLKELEAKLIKLGGVAGGKVLRQALMAAANPMVKSAKAKVPVDRGKLKSNIRKRSKLGKGKSNTVAEVMMGVTKKAWYGHLVEFGTINTPAQPFLRPAFDENKTKVVQLFRAQLEKRIKKVAGK